MKVCTLKVILHDRLGRLPIGKVVDLPDHQANFFLGRGEVERYETKEIRERPSVAAGENAQSFASPPAQALPQATLKQSAPGAKKTRKAAR